MCNRAAVAKHAELAFGLGTAGDDRMLKAFRKLPTRYPAPYRMEIATDRNFVQPILETSAIKISPVRMCSVVQPAPAS